MVTTVGAVIVIVATIPIAVIATVISVIVVVAMVAIRVIAAVVIIFTAIYTPMMSAVDASNAPGC
jgi:hypothetical protein